MTENAAAAGSPAMPAISRDAETLFDAVEPSMPKTPKRSIRTKLANVAAWLQQCREGSSKFPLTRWGRPDYGSISRLTMGTKGFNLIPGHPVRDLIDAHWESIRYDIDPSKALQPHMEFGSTVATACGVAAMNAAPDTYAITNFSTGRLGEVMPVIVETLDAHRKASHRTSAVAHAWWLAFDAWRGVRDERGFQLWLRHLMETPTGIHKNILLPQQVLGLLRRHGLLLLPLGLVTGSVPHPCSSWCLKAKARFLPDALTEWEHAALLPASKPYRATTLLLTIAPMAGVSEFPRDAFVAAIGGALSREGAAARERQGLTGRAFELASKLDHQSSLRTDAARGPGRASSGAGAGAAHDDAGGHAGNTFRAALDGHLREAGLRGRGGSPEAALMRSSGGPAGEWADLLLRYINDQSWKAPVSTFYIAQLIVDQISALAPVPKLDDADLRARLLEGPGSFAMRWEELAGGNEYMLNTALSTLRRALAWHASSVPTFRNPIRPSDIPPRGGASKSNKLTLPRDIIEEAKVVCRELMALAWDGASEIPATFLHPRWRDLLTVKVPVPGQGLVPRISPVLPSLLFALLSIPVRGIQGRLLDSGEGDEIIPVLRDGDGPASSRIDWIPNTHPLACAKRKQGAIRRIFDAQSASDLTGLWINTNKTKAQGRGRAEDQGYEIPWQLNVLIEMFCKLRAWQSTYNPVDRFVSRAELSEASLRPTEALKKRMPGYAYLFRHLRDGAPSRRLEPVRENYLVRVFLAVMEEIELRRKGTPGEIKLIVSRCKGVPASAIYTVHGLRVTGITAFAAAGVPLPIIAEFLAGHLSVLMTIYYTKLGPATVTEILENALAASCVDGRDGTIGGREFDGIRDALIGNDGSSTSRLADTNPAQFAVKIDGLCPNGQSRCHEGGGSSSSREGVPTPGGPRNCALCRFWVTGEPFLSGQVVAINALIYAIREKAEALLAAYSQLRALPPESTRRHSSSNAVDTLEVELDIMVRTLQARYRLVLKSMEKAASRVRGDLRPAIIGNSPDAFADLRQVSELRFLAAVSSGYELFPETSTASAPIRRNVLIDLIRDRDGLQACLFRAPTPEQAMRAGSLHVDLMCRLTGGEAGLDDLAAGKVSLASFGTERVNGEFLSALGPTLAASLAGPQPVVAQLHRIG